MGSVAYGSALSQIYNITVICHIWSLGVNGIRTSGVDSLQVETESLRDGSPQRGPRAESQWGSGAIHNLQLTNAF